MDVLGVSVTGNKWSESLTGAYALEVFLTQGSTHANASSLHRKKRDTEAKIARASPGIAHFFMVVVQWAEELNEPRLEASLTFLLWEPKTRTWEQILCVELKFLTFCGSRTHWSWSSMTLRAWVLLLRKRKLASRRVAS